MKIKGGGTSRLSVIVDLVLEEDCVVHLLASLLEHSVAC